jgi:hypothetical protein
MGTNMEPIGISPNGVDNYRLIVTRRDLSEVLILANESDSLSYLPTAQILPNRRVAQQLTEEILRRWQLQTCCLFIAPRQHHPEMVIRTTYVVMEWIGPAGNISKEICWKSLAQLDLISKAPGTDTFALQTSIQELKAHLANPNSGPFLHPGWLKNLFAWSGEQLEMLGLRLTGVFAQLNASPNFSLIRLETTGPAVWFKATGVPNHRELSISVAIARLLPAYVPLMLGIHLEWNGWLSGELPGSPLTDISNSADWERVASTLAYMQIESIRGTASLIEAGCKDLRIPNLKKHIEPFLAQMLLLMERQEKTKPAPLDSAQLDLVRLGLNEACSQLSQLGLPDTISHIDFNPGNTMVSPNKCCFLDWAEGAVSNPFLTFEYLLEHYRRRGSGEGSLQSLRNAYVRPWLPLFSPSVLETALSYSPLIALFAYAVRDLDWRTETSHRDPRVAGYFRALARRMHVETLRFTESRVSCFH